MKPSRLYDAYELKHALKVKRLLRGTFLSWIILFCVGNYIYNFLSYFCEGFLGDKIV